MRRKSISICVFLDYVGLAWHVGVAPVRRTSAAPTVECYGQHSALGCRWSTGHASVITRLGRQTPHQLPATKGFVLQLLCPAGPVSTTHRRKCTSRRCRCRPTSVTPTRPINRSCPTSTPIGTSDRTTPTTVARVGHGPTFATAPAGNRCQGFCSSGTTRCRTTSSAVHNDFYHPGHAGRRESEVGGHGGFHKLSAAAVPTR